MTEFLHARLHHERWLGLVGGWAVADPTPACLLVACPGCGMEFFAANHTLAVPRDRTPSTPATHRQLTADKGAAQFVLRLQCPDHPHRFRVG